MFVLISHHTVSNPLRMALIRCGNAQKLYFPSAACREGTLQEAVVGGLNKRLIRMSQLGYLLVFINTHSKFTSVKILVLGCFRVKC